MTIQTLNQANAVYDAGFNGAVVKRAAGGQAMADQMPDPAVVGGKFKMTIINLDSSASIALSTPNGTFDLNSTSQYTLPPGMAVQFESDGANWTTFVRTFPA